jgi:hypothetical protein
MPQEIPKTIEVLPQRSRGKGGRSREAQVHEGEALAVGFLEEKKEKS